MRQPAAEPSGSKRPVGTTGAQSSMSIGGSPADQRERRVLLTLGVVANAATLAWAALAIFVAGRGLGLGNEGFYLLAYGGWEHDHRTFTGAQYLFGPVFDLLGRDIAALRILRLAVVLAVHLSLAVAFARWLRSHRPSAYAGVAWEYCVASLVVASGAIVYGWLPPTPGYNDVTLLGSFVMLALLFTNLRAASSGHSPPAWTGLVWGFVAGMMTLAKPTVVVSVLAIAVVSGYALRSVGARPTRLLLAVIAGVGLFIAYVQLFVAPWGVIVPPLREQLEIVSGSTHSPGETIGWYLESTLDLVKGVIVVCLPMGLAAAGIWALRRRPAPVRTVVGLIGLAASTALLAGAGGLHAGGTHVLGFASGIVAMLVVLAASIGTALRPRRPVMPSAGVVALLALVPVLQGFGTNNALYAVAVNGSACWVALMITALTGIPTGVTPRFVLPAAATLLAVCLCVVVGIDGVSHDGSGRALLRGPMARISGSQELETIVLPAPDAAGLSQLRRDLGIASGTHRPMLAYGDLAQYVLVLGGRPIGEPWYSAQDDGLNAADLRAACRSGNPWGDRQPLVVANREPTSSEVAAWRTCGVDFASDYDDVTPPSAPDGIHVLAARAGQVAEGH